MAKHRAPRYVRTKHAISRVPVAAGATAVGLGVLSTPAQASTAAHDWTGVAQCESGGDWSINTGNGYYGGLQFSQATWAGFGGTALAARADLATPAQQVEIAEKVLAGQGVGAWPTCGKLLTDGTTAAAAAAPAAAAEPAAPAAEAAPAESEARAEEPTDSDTYGEHAATGDYTVVRGDTVATIAAAHNESWRTLYQRNVDVIGANPNLIFPGQVLATSGEAQAAPASEAPAAEAPVAEAPAAEAPAVEAPAAEAPAVEAPAAEPAEPAAPAAPVEASAGEAVAPAPAPVAVAPVSSVVAHITNSYGDVAPQVQTAANTVAGSVPGADALTIGGTRPSATDPHGHPSGLALDYMVRSDAALGDALVRYHVEHWDELGVEYVIWQQRILTSPTGSWKQMADRGSTTANHYDHVHVNYDG